MEKATSSETPSASAVKLQDGAEPGLNSGAFRRAWPWMALLLILALGFSLRMYQLDRRSVWLDEFWALAVSAGHALESGQPIGVIIDPAPPPPTSLANAVSWHEVWFATGETTHPPLYYIFLRLWREAFGESQAVARGMSVAFGLAAILLFYGVAGHLLSRTAALWSTLLMAVAVPQIVHSQEIRNYTPQLALALCATLAVLRMEKRGPSFARAAALAISLLALVLTHYFSVGFAAGLLVYALYRLPGRARWIAAAAFAAAAALFILTWGPRFWEQRVEFGVSATENNWLWDPYPLRGLRALRQAMLVPAQLICPLDEETEILSYLGAALFVLPLALWRRRPELQLPGLWLLSSVGMLVVLDATRSSLHLNHLRYSFIASPAVYLLLAGLAQNIRVVGHLLPALAALSCALPLRTHYGDAYVDWRWPAQGIREYVRPGDVMVFSSEGGPPYQAYQSFIVLSHYAGQLQGPVVIAPQRPDPAVVEQLRHLGRTTWLVTGVGWVEAEEILPGAKFQTRFQYYGTVDLWLMAWPDTDEGGDAPASSPASLPGDAQ
jgi:hypothetical protein